MTEADLWRWKNRMSIVWRTRSRTIASRLSISLSLSLPPSPNTFSLRRDERWKRDETKGWQTALAGFESSPSRNYSTFRYICKIWIQLGNKVFFSMRLFVLFLSLFCKLMHSLYSTSNYILAQWQDYKKNVLSHFHVNYSLLKRKRDALKIHISLNLLILHCNFKYIFLFINLLINFANL